MKQAYINSYESLSCAGDTKQLMRAIFEKKSGITLNSTFMSSVEVGLGKMEYEDFFVELRGVVQRVLDTSNLKDFHKTLLIVGSSVGGMAQSEKHYFKDKNYKNIDPNKHAISVIGDALQESFAFYDVRAISTACTSSANALLLAKRLINVEAYENVLVVGADALCYTTVCGFYALSVLSTKPCRPFDEEREGMNVAEAIATLLVQSQKTQESIELCGVGASSDAYHMTNPDPEANGAIKAMQNALDDAGVNAKEIDYVNAHGTGTQANDTVESLAVESLFSGVYLSSTKAITGHTLGAAGALEAIISCESIKQGKIPPQTNMKNAENKNVNILQETQSNNVRYVMSNSFAFGGNNTSIIFKGVVS